MSRELMSVLLCAALAGCAKSAEVQLSMKNAGGGDGFTPSSVELQHEKDGWINVAVASAEAAAGAKAALATAEVPKGTYTGARIGFSHMVEVEVDAPAPSADEEGGDEDDGGTRAMTRGPRTEMMRKDGSLTSDGEFCVSKGDEVTLVVREGKDGALKLKVNAPEC